MATRDSTSLRLAPKEKAFIAKAAATLGDDLGEFIRNAARARAEEVLESAAYRDFLEEKVKRAVAARGVEPSLTNEQMKKRLAARRRK